MSAFWSSFGLSFGKDDGACTLVSCCDAPLLPSLPKWVKAPAIKSTSNHNLRRYLPSWPRRSFMNT